MNVFVGQAIDEQVKLLRQPLSIHERPPGVRNERFALIGGKTAAVRRLCDNVHEHLFPFFHNVALFSTIEEFASSEFAKPQATANPVAVMCLTDLDHAFLETMTAPSFDALKALVGAAGTLMWVTQGALDGKSYSYMMTGILRTVRTEQPHLGAQMYDLEGPDGSFSSDTASDLAITLLQQHLLLEWGIDTDTLLWTKEPEVYVRNGRQFVPRLLPDVARNQRYNARRRKVRASVLPDKKILQLAGNDQSDEGAVELCWRSPHTIEADTEGASRRIKVVRSILQNITVPAAGVLALCTGTDLETKEAVLALSHRHESVIVVPSQWCISLSAIASVSNLVTIAANMIVEYVFSFIPPGGSIVCHEPEPAVQRAIQEKAVSANVKTVFTTAQPSVVGLLHIHPATPLRNIQEAIPESTSVFVSFSRDTAAGRLKDTISSVLPLGCLRLNEDALMSNKTRAYSFNMNLKTLLQSAAQSVAPTLDLSIFPDSCLDLGQVSGHPTVREQLTVIDWEMDEPIAAMISPIDCGDLFRADRTYLFIGMAGELGQSLAEWMISRGARNVVLTSRNPKVSSDFMDVMAMKFGAMIKPMPLDITSWDSLQDVLKAITANLPPIAGIINGAMILEDELFSNMSYDNFARVTAPKVIGTELLDQAFHDDAGLEFFIVASSIASLIGWTGQSNYSAANEYMTALVRSRRKRGVPGSVMNIPAVLGVGYAAHAKNFNFEYFQSLGHINISEEDLHILFAEAVLAGREPTSDPQIGMGVTYIPRDLEVKAAHKRDVKFSHFIQREKTTTDQGAMKTDVRVKVQLQTADTPEKAQAVVRDAFVAYLRRMLRLGADENIDETASLTDQGIDSLVAVDIRSWFLKEVGVDVPTLKILGGDSVSGLVQLGLEKMALFSGEPNTLDSEKKESAGSSPSSTSPVFTAAQDDDRSSVSTVESLEHRTK